MTASTFKQGWIGVDVGTRAVKLAQVDHTSGRFRLRDAVVIPRNSGGVGPAPEAEHGGCAQEVHSGLTVRGGFVGPAAACTLSMRQCQVKPLKIPRGGDPWSHVADQLRSLGCSSDHEFDFWSTGTAAAFAEPEEEQVVAVAVPQRVAAEVTGDLFRCGLDCRLLDAIPLCLARAVRRTAPPEEQRSIAVLDWGFAEATFCTIRGQTTTFVRRLRECGFSRVLRQVGDELGLRLDELEAILSGGDNARCVPGRSDPLCVQLNEAIPGLASQSLHAMAAEIQRTLSFLETQFPESVPDRVWLFGAGALWRGAAAHLAAKINRPVDGWNFAHAGIEASEALSRLAPLLGPAISLSLLAWQYQ